MPDRRPALPALAAAFLLPALASAAPTKIIDDEVTVTAETSYGPLAPWGYAPVWAELKNNAGRPRRVELTFKTHSDGPSASRTVLLDPRETRVVSLPVPASVYGGRLMVKTPSGGGESGILLSTSDTPRVLVVGSGPDLVALAGFSKEKPDPDSTSPAEQAQRGLMELTPRTLPDLAAAYVGTSVLVLADLDPGALTPSQRAALETWVLTGGTLAYGPRPLSAGAPRTLGIGADVAPGHAVEAGFGRVVALADDAALGSAMHELLVQTTLDLGAEQAAPSVTEVFGDTARLRSAPGSTGGLTLLPGVGRPPVGAFLFIIFLYVLAVGPGSFLVARKYGRMWVLATVPLTAFATCTGIGAYGVASDGVFTVHHGSSSVTRLDTAGKRAITIGTSAIYAAFAPSALHESTTGFILPSTQGGATDDWRVDWSEGQVVGGGVVPARSYREFAYAEVSPSVARVVLAGSGQPELQNVLGGTAKTLAANIDGRLYLAQDVPAGGKALMQPTDPPLDITRTFEHTALFGHAGAAAQEAVTSPLADGEFIAVLDDWNELPTQGIRVSPHPSTHIIRGRVSR